jgi:hypothetical protein
MKLIKLALLLVAILGLAVSGCKKDDAEANYLQVGDTTIVLNDGNIKYYGIYGTATYNFDIDFVSPEIVLSSGSDGVTPTYTGTGSKIYFETYTGSATELLSGSYTFLDDGNYSDGTFDYSHYAFDYNSSDGGTRVYIENGTLTVKALGGYKYDIKYSGLDENGVAVKMHYKGTLTYYDRSEKKK